MSNKITVTNVTNAGSTIKILNSGTGSGSGCDCNIDYDFIRSEVKTVVDDYISENGIQAYDDTEIKRRLDSLEYVPINIESFAINPTTAELGYTVRSVTLNWRINKVPATLTYNNVNINELSNTGNISIATNITSNKTYTLKAIDDRGGESSKTANIKFYNSIYYGYSNMGSLSEQLFRSLQNKVLSDTRARTITISSGIGQYIYYILPSRLGTPIFHVGGFEGGFSKVASQVNHTNGSGYVERYDVWRSDNSGLGSTTITIS